MPVLAAGRAAAGCDPLGGAAGDRYSTASGRVRPVRANRAHGARFVSCGPPVKDTLASGVRRGVPGLPVPGVRGWLPGPCSAGSRTAGLLRSSTSARRSRSVSSETAVVSPGEHPRFSQSSHSRAAVLTAQVSGLQSVLTVTHVRGAWSLGQSVRTSRGRAQPGDTACRFVGLPAGDGLSRWSAAWREQALTCSHTRAPALGSCSHSPDGRITVADCEMTVRCGGVRLGSHNAFLVGERVAGSLRTAPGRDRGAGARTP